MRKKLILGSLLLLTLQNGLQRYQVVADHSWWKTILVLYALLPLSLIIWVGYISLIRYFKQRSQSVMAATFGAILFLFVPLMFSLFMLVLKAGSFMNYGFERHPKNIMNYDQEIPIAGGRVYSWIMGTPLFGFPGVCAFFEKPLGQGFYLRHCFCYQDERGSFDLKRVDDNSVACVRNGKSEVFEL